MNRPHLAAQHVFAEDRALLARAAEAVEVARGHLRTLARRTDSPPWPAVQAADRLDEAADALAEAFHA